MPSPSPSWRRAFDRVERRIGAPLERLVRSDPFFDAVTAVARTRSGVDRRLERCSRRVLHAANLPTATDFARARHDLARIDRGVAGLTKTLEDSREVTADAVGH